MQRKTEIWTLVALLGTVVAGNASASGFQLLEQNVSGLGNAYAGSAVVGENASTVFYNPAAMTKLPGGNFSAGLTVLKPSYKFKDDGSATSGSAGGDAGNWAYLPNLYSTWQVNDKLFAGVGFGSTFGLRTEYEPDWIGRYQSVVFDIKTYNVNPSLAYKLTDSLSFGAGLNWQRMEVNYERKAATVNAATQATSVVLDANGETLGWNAGVTFKPSQSTEMGFSYRSKMFHNLKGSLTSSNQAVAQDVFSSADITLPDTYILSVSQQISERWTMLGDLSRTNWSSIDKVAIMRTSGAQSGTVAQTLDVNFRDVWRVALGGTYKINDSWKWKYGVAYDQSPVRGTEERLVSLPDNNRYWFSTGAQWKMDKASTVDLGVAYLHIPTDRTVSNQTSSARGSVVGDYKGSIVIFGAQYSRVF